MVQSLSPLGLFQLGTVTMRELLKPCRVVAVPLAQLRGRGHILTPLVECCSRLGHSPRPNPVDQDPDTVVVIGLVVHPAYPHIRHRGHGPNLPGRFTPKTTPTTASVATSPNKTWVYQRRRSRPGTVG